MKPPLPPSTPPRAASLPETRVAASALTTIVPPSPETPALASIDAPAATSTSRPSTFTSPPRAAPSSPIASSVPVSATRPVRPASSTMRPPRSTSERARTTPDWLTTEPTSAPAARAVITACPPSAIRTPLLRNCTSSAASDTDTRVSPSPARSSVTRFPAAIATVPSRALIVPSLLTCAPSSATDPPSAARIVPEFATLPPLPAKCSRASRKSWFEMSSVDATIPPTSTVAPRPNSTPFGLTRKICPLALIRPRISLGAVPTTRLSITLVADG